MFGKSIDQGFPGCVPSKTYCRFLEHTMTVASATAVCATVCSFWKGARSAAILWSNSTSEHLSSAYKNTDKIFLIWITWFFLLKNDRKRHLRHNLWYDWHDGSDNGHSYTPIFQPNFCNLCIVKTVGLQLSLRVWARGNSTNNNHKMNLNATQNTEKR